MELTITLNDLTRYIYKETTTEETSAIEDALVTDFDLRERFESLKASAEALDCEMMRPNQSTIDRIMNYSKRTAPMETSH